MEDAQWETVIKSRKQRNLEKKFEAHVERKRIEAIKPKLEEILPLKQYRKIISTNETMKVKNNSPTKSNASSDKSKSPKKIAKKENNKRFQAQQGKVEKPKSLEMAMRGISTEEFLNQLEILKQTYPGSELLWLRGIASFLNGNLPFDCDPTFSSKSINYPSILLTKDLKHIIVEFLKEMGETNLSYFYHNLMANMCMELSKNLSVVGYKLLLQLIGRNWPKICSGDLARTALLRNSYQNRSNICLSIFWAIAQGGYSELEVGVKVWQNLMLSNLDMKSYTRFVVEYIEKILNTAVYQRLTMDQQTFFDIYNVLRTQNNNISKDCQESLNRSAALFLQKYISCSIKHANIFLQLFRDIDHSQTNSIELDGCISCLIKGDDSFKIWRMNLKKQVLPSTLLLEKIVTEWSNIGSALEKSKQFDNFLNEAEILTKELEFSKKKIPKLEGLVESLKSAQQTASQSKKSKSSTDEKKCGCCKWMLGIFFLIALIAGALTYDTNVNGRGVFAQSATGKMLKNAGMLPHVEKAWYVSMSAAARGYKWAEVNVPPYAKPVGNLMCDLYKVARNAACNAYHSANAYAASKLPVVAAFLEQYIPGLPGHIERIYTSVKECLLTGLKAGLDVWNGIEFGLLSRENLSRMANETKNAALDYYYTFHKKVDAYAKLK